MALRLLILVLAELRQGCLQEFLGLARQLVHRRRLGLLALGLLGQRAGLEPLGQQVRLLGRELRQ